MVQGSEDIGRLDGPEVGHAASQQGPDVPRRGAGVFQRVPGEGAKLVAQLEQMIVGHSGPDLGLEVTVSLGVGTTLPIIAGLEQLVRLQGADQIPGHLLRFWAASKILDHQVIQLGLESIGNAHGRHQRGRCGRRRSHG